MEFSVFWLFSSFTVEKVNNTKYLGIRKIIFQSNVIVVAGLRPAKNREPGTGVFLEFCEISKSTLVAEN